jgi:hypothetical protein
MRVCLFAVLLLALGFSADLSATSGSALGATRAASWHTFRSKSLGISFRYPSGWAVAPQTIGAPGGSQVVVSQQSEGLSLTAGLVPIHGAPSLRRTVQLFAAYQRAMTHSTMYDHVHWTSASLGGKAALAGVIHPATEGGVVASDGLYIAQTRSRVYQVMIVSNQKPALTKIGQFPAVYRAILATWRFL